jgi:TM2 domain-containing membrane protein YozV
MEQTGAVYTLQFDGITYGPVDLMTLGQWAREGRVLADTVILDTASDFKFRADEHPDLRTQLNLATIPIAPPQATAPPQTTLGGTVSNPNRVYVTQQQMQASRPVDAQSMQQYAGRRVSAGIFAVLFGGLGVHKFHLGYNSEGLIMLLLSLFGFPVWILLAAMGMPLLFPPLIMGIIGIIEGITYLSKTDEDFVQTYVQKKKGWF